MVLNPIVMRLLLKSLDLPLYMSCAVLLVSLIYRRNIFADEALAFSACFAAMWGISWFIKRRKKQ